MGEKGSSKYVCVLIIIIFTRRDGAITASKPFYFRGLQYGNNYDGMIWLLLQRLPYLHTN